MRSLMLLVAIAIAGATALGLEANKEYIYKYETQAVTGVPHHAVEYAGTKIKATVKIQVKTDNRVTLKLEDVAIYKIQTSIHTWPESGLLPESVLTPVEGTILSELNKELFKPVKFTYTNGEIENLKTDPEEAVWSVNIKKGLISTLKLKLKEESENKLGDQQINELQKNNIPERYEEVMMKTKVYRVMETTVSGLCESIYGIENVTPEERREGAADTTTTLKVTKVRNYDKCAKAPVYEQGLISGLTISTEQLETKDLIEMTSQADYELKGTREDFVITKARQDSKYILTPLTPTDGSVVTSVVQVLTLEQEKAIEVAIQPEMQLRLRPKGLLYEFPATPFEKDMTLERAKHEEEREGMTAEQITEEIERLLEKTIPMMIPIVREESIDNIKVIESLLKRLSVEEIMSLCEKYLKQEKIENINRPKVFSNRRPEEVRERRPNNEEDWNRKTEDEENRNRRTRYEENRNRKTQDRERRIDGDENLDVSKKAEIILDLIPTMTSSKSLPVIAKLISSRKITTTRAAISIRIIAMMVTPDVKLMEFLDPRNTEYMSNPVIQNNKVLRQTVALTTGTIWNRLLKLTTNAGLPYKKLVDFAVPKKASLLEMVKRADNATKIAYLKGFSNSGYPAIIPFASMVITDKTEDIQVRKNALYLFKRIPLELKPKARTVLTSVYMDLTEAPQMRMNAFVALMDTKPGPGILNIISRVQRKEKSIQVGSFVYSYLSTLAKAELPGFIELAKDIRKIMPLVRPVNPNTITGSKGIHIDYLSKHATMGAALEIFKINDGKTTLPSTLVSRVMLHTMGKTLGIVEAGISTKGVDHILSKIMGAHKSLLGSLGEKSLKEVIEAILIPLQSGNVDLGDIKEEVKSVIEKLGIIDRSTLEKLNIEFFLSLFGNEISFIDITAEDVLKWIKTGKVPILGDVEELAKELLAGGKMIDILKVINLGTSTLQIPSAAGIPVSFNFTGTGAVHINGNAALLTSLPEVGLQSSVKISTSHAWVAAMGVDVGLIKTGVGLKGTLKTNYPITLDVKANTKTWKLSTALELPDEVGETVNAKIEPTAFVTIIDPTKPVQNRKLSTIPLSHPSRVELLDATVPVTLPVLNTKLTMKFINPVTLPKWMPISWLWAPSAMVVKMAPITSGTTANIKLEINTAMEETNLKEIIPQEISIHPIMTAPRGVTIALKAGSGNDKAEAVVTLITSEDMKKTQVNVLVKAPTVIPSPLITELVLDVEGLSSRKLETLSPTTLVGEMKMVLDTKTVTVKAFPAGSDKITWNKYEKNNFLKLIELFTKEKITSRVTKPASEKPSELNYKLEIDTNVNLSEMSKLTTAVTTAIVTAGYMTLQFPNIPVSYVETISNAPSTIEGQMKITPMFQKVDIVLKTPAGMKYSLELPGCIYEPWHKLLSLETPVVKSESDETPEEAPVAAYYHGYQLETLAGKCAVYRSEEESEDSVKTFDQYTYTLPSLPSSCEVVLAKDCSELSLFTVLIKPVEEAKVLKVLIPRNKIEIVPQTSWLSSVVSCKVIVNGLEIPVTEGARTPLTETREYGKRSSSEEIGEISKTDDWLTVHLSTLGLTVSTDGKQVVIKTSPFMRSHLCGLCGNFNDESWDDLEGPDMSRYTTAEEMISRYVVPTPSCPVDEVRENLGINEQVTCTPTERTVVMERDDETCFSTTPVPVCPTGCRPDTISSTATIPFHCKDTNSNKARRYIQEAREEGVVEELEYKPESTRIPVQIPETCSPMN